MIHPYWRVMLKRASENNQFHMFKWLQELKPSKKFSFSSFHSAVFDAARGGSLQALEWFEKFACFEDVLPEIVLIAAKSGHLPVVQKYAIEDGKFLAPEQSLAQKAISSGNLELVKWLHQNGCSFEGCFSFPVIITIEIGKWLYDQGYGVSNIAFYEVDGNLDTLKWLREHGGEWGEHSAITLARNGNLSLFKWALENGYKFDDPFIYSLPAREGNLEMITWLHERGCPLNAGVFFCAFRSQNVELLTWLRDHGCPCDEANANDLNLETFKWAHENGYTITNIEAATFMDKPDILRYAHEQGFNVRTALGTAATFSGSTAILDFFKEIGAAFTPKHWSETAKRKRFWILRWARDNNYEMTEETLKALEDDDNSIFYG